jgi:hypothetical protein
MIGVVRPTRYYANNCTARIRDNTDLVNNILKYFANRWRLLHTTRATTPNPKTTNEHQ